MGSDPCTSCKSLCSKTHGSRLSLKNSTRSPSATLGSPLVAIAFVGSDLARGETVLRAGQVLTSGEIGMLAAVGCAAVDVWRRPRVAIISTGDEIVAPGKPIRPGAVYNSNAAILAAAVEEAGGSAKPLGIGADNEIVLSRLVDEGLAGCDMVILSGGTSKGAGDLCYRAIASFNDPGIVVHGVALKPGKPLCLAVTGGKPIVILPGFPTSAIFTFHEFVAPVIRAFAGLPVEQAERLPATLPMRIVSERGRTEYLMVSLVRGDGAGPLAAYPNSKGSGAVTAFSQADAVHHDRPACREPARWHTGRGAVDRPGAPRRSRHHREPLRRARRADRTAASRRDLGQGAQCRQHRWACGRQARRVRHRRDPFDGPGNRRVQSSVPDPGAGTRLRLSPLARDRLPQRRPALRGAVYRGRN